MPTTAATGGIAGLAGRLCDEAGFDSIVTALRSGRSATVDGVWGSSCALTLAGLARGLDGAVLALAPRPADVDDLAVDLETFLSVRPATFPALETLDAENPAADPLFGKRLALVETLTDGRPVDAGVVVTSLPALMQPVPAPASLAAARRTVAVRDEVAPEDLVRWVVDRGFERVGSVERPGEVALRGDILDLWSPGTDRPVRAEFFGDEVDGLRRFDPETQRKIETLDEVEVVAFSADDAGGATASLLDLLPDDAVVAFVELPQIEDEARGYLDRLDDPRGLYGVDATVAKCTERASVSLAAIAPDSVEETYRLPVESIERLGGDRTQVVADLAEVLGKTGRATIVCHAEGERARIAELLTEFDAGLELKNEDPISARVETALGRVGKGFRLISENLLIVGDHELFGRTEVRRSARRKRKDADSRAIDSFIDLNKGDLIVHLTHGIGRFRGMKVLEKEGQAEEHLELEFADEVKIFVPASLIHLVQKYIGAKKAAPKLSTLGGQAWA
ncbi:MAG: CarD family transcriptional regulator, partial [Planctomycetota bacterium]